MVGKDEFVRRRILMMDDDELTLAIQKDALEMVGFAVLCARDLVELAYHRVRSRPHLILLDVDMPDVSGDDLARALRGAHAVQIPILLVSALDDAELEARARAAGVDGFVCKRRGVTALVREVCAHLRDGDPVR